jgi:hypothetical protein
MKEGRERENSATFCGWGGLVKEMRGEVWCHINVEERRGAIDARSTREGGPVAIKAHDRWQGIEWSG